MAMALTTMITAKIRPLQMELVITVMITIAVIITKVK